MRPSIQTARLQHSRQKPLSTPSPSVSAASAASLHASSATNVISATSAADATSALPAGAVSAGAAVFAPAAASPATSVPPARYEPSRPKVVYQHALQNAAAVGAIAFETDLVLYKVSPMNWMRNATYLSWAQLAYNLGLLPYFLRLDSITEPKRAAICVATMSWGIGVYFIWRWLSSRLVVELSIPPTGSSAKISFVNALGKLSVIDAPIDPKTFQLDAVIRLFFMPRRTFYSFSVDTGGKRKRFLIPFQSVVPTNKIKLEQVLSGCPPWQS